MNGPELHNQKIVVKKIHFYSRVQNKLEKVKTRVNASTQKHLRA